jgi:hypothetical protein
MSTFISGLVNRGVMGCGRMPVRFLKPNREVLCQYEQAQIYTMKLLPWTSLLILLAATGCGGIGPWNFANISGSGTVVTEERAVADFDRVSLSGVGRLTIIQGDVEGLTITTDDNLLEQIQSTVSGRHLRIGPDQVSLRPTRDIQYVLQVKELRRLDLSGSLSATAVSLQTDSLALGISGSGKIEIENLDAERCESRISGSGRVDLSGRSNALDLQVSGSGHYGAANLQSLTASIRISGSGDATVWVRENLDASISGSGSVSYYGNPKTSQSVSGSGKLRALGSKPS